MQEVKDVPNVGLVTLIVTCCPAVPLKVRLAFWPAAVLPVVGTLTAAPPTVTVPVKSAGTLAICKVSLPKLVP